MREYRLLIIDDDKTDRQLYRRLLSNKSTANHYEVVEAANAEEGLRMVMSEQPDCILLDYMLPDIDGVGFIKNLKKLTGDQTIPIIMLTGHGDEDIAVKAMKEGVSDYIIKDQVNADLIHKSVINVLEKEDLRRKVKQQQHELLELAMNDPLTHLLNRRGFELAAKRVISDAIRHERMLAMLYIDIDCFKAINDNHGHTVGDAVLAQFAERLVDALREEDVIGRIGGDEFAVIATGVTSIHDAGQVAKKLLSDISVPYSANGKIVETTVSIGIACYPETGDNLDDLQRCADAALYRVKQSGRNGMQFYTEELNSIYRYRFDLEADLRTALEKEQLFLAYQPWVDVREKKLKGMEVLLRWQHPKLGVLSPVEFIQVAQESNLMVEISKWIVKTAYRQYAQWYHAGHKGYSLVLPFNLSLQQLVEYSILAEIHLLIEEHDIPPALLQLELSESSLVGQKKASQEVVNALKGVTLQLSIDDFGSGHASLTYLKRLPIGSLKINQSFLTYVDTDNVNANIVRYIIHLANALNISVIAEGVETEEQAEFLLENECSQMQGFYISKPMTPAEMEAYLKKHS